MLCLLVSVTSSAFADTCDLQDQRGGHSGLRAGRGHADHPLHVLHQHADELHVELCRCRLQGAPCVKGEVKTPRLFAPSQYQRLTSCYRPPGDSLRFPAWSRPRLPADEGGCNAHCSREGDWQRQGVRNTPILYLLLHQLFSFPAQ